MKIDSISVNADYCFGKAPLKLDKLGKVNFIFASNGSGKTTISSALSQQPEDPQLRTGWSVAPTDLPIRVFNEAYRTQVLTEHVNGIFTVGDQSKDINDQIKVLREKIRTRHTESDKLKQEIGSCDAPESSTGLLGDIDKEKCIAREAVFSQHKVTVPKPVTEIIFKGFRTKKEAFFDEALRRYLIQADNAPDYSWRSLVETSLALHSGVTTRAQLPEILTTSLISPKEIAELKENLPISGIGPMAELIEKMGNEDWVSQGRGFIATSLGKCPFCQQDQPDELETNLAEYFAGGFDKALERARIIGRTVRDNAKDLERELTVLESAISSDSEIEMKPIQDAVAVVRAAAELLLSRMAEKEDHPTRPIETTDICDVISLLSELIDEENRDIERQNNVVANSKTAQARLVDEGWSLFLSDATVSAAIKRFRGIESSKNNEITKKKDTIAENLEANDIDTSKIEELQNSISNTRAVATRINELLCAMGFYRFKLQVADDVTGGYQIVREDGTLAVSSLSEGEKSFICFVYFWESLSGSTISGAPPEDVVAVIDDPISSLDSDSLFIVASYIRDAAESVIKETSNIRQLIVLTHNTQFHHEAAYTNDRLDAAKRHYYRLLKDTEGYSYVQDDQGKCRIRGSYPLLWDAIVEAAKDQEDSSLVRVGTLNITRRIIEGYFRTVGKVKDFTSVEGQSPVDARILRMFIIWANSGSHIIADDVDQTAEAGGTRRFLKLFRRFFDLQGHTAHFEMMIRASDGEDLLEPGELFG